MSLLHNYGGPCGPKKTTIQWQILPIKPVLVRFRMSLAVRSRISNLLKEEELSLDQIEQNSSRLIPILEGFWNNQALKGAILISPWISGGNKLPEGQSGGNSEGRVFLSLEPLLVLNVLCRSRAGLLLPNLPLAIEIPFLKRDLVTADQRLIQLADKEAHYG
jgi:hypothetical protein